MMSFNQNSKIHSQITYPDLLMLPHEPHKQL